MRRHLGFVRLPVSSGLPPTVPQPPIIISRVAPPPNNTPISFSTTIPPYQVGEYHTIQELNIDMSGRGRGIDNTPAWMNDRSSSGSSGAAAPPPSRPSRPADYFDDRHDSYDRRRGPPPRDRLHGGPRGRRGGPPFRGGRRTPPPGVIIFRSRQEEEDWVEERRRKRLARPSKFDQGPAVGSGTTAVVNPAEVAAAAAAALAAAAGPQQTRHARRLYVGNLPLGVTEEQIHQEFRQAIERALISPTPLTEDPILSVYINHERRFCFLEFKTVEMTTACMSLDGYNLRGQALKIKRPNDYQEALAPRVHPSALPNLDVSRLGMVSGTVLDGPNKIFIGGLHYHLTDAQVLELLQAFGPVKAFHLVKADSEGVLSKGYCFVEYVDPNTTSTAIQGLNGMDIGGGKTLTARLAGSRDGGTVAPTVAQTTAPAVAVGGPGQPPADRTIVHGYDIEALVDAAMGKGTMPTQPVYMDAMGVPITQIVPLEQQIAAAAQDALAKAAVSVSNSATSTPPSRVLVLHNMVQPDDLATDADHAALKQEVEEECAKFGTLLDVVIPRTAEGAMASSAVGKIFLRYSTMDQAAKATSELQGRAFGDSVVQVTTLAEDDFEAGHLQ